MTVGHKYCLHSKLPIHLDIKYNMQIDVLVSRINLPFPHLIRCNAVKLLKCNTDDRCRFCNSIGPKFIPRLPVLGNCIPNLCDVRQYLDFTLEIILSLCSQSLLNPQVEGRFITNLICHGILIHINWVGLSKIL